MLNYLYETQTIFLYFHIHCIQTTRLLSPLFQSKRFPSECKLQRGSEPVPTSSLFHNVSQNFGCVFHIVRPRRYHNRNDHHLDLHIRFGEHRPEIGLSFHSELICRQARTSLPNFRSPRREWGKREKYIQCVHQYSLSLFTKSRRLCKLDLIHDISLILIFVLETFTGFCFQQILRHFFLFCGFCTYGMPLPMEIRRFIPILSSAHPGSENSRSQFLYKDVTAGCETSLIKLFSVSSNSLTLSYGS